MFRKLDLKDVGAIDGSISTGFELNRFIKMHRNEGLLTRKKLPDLIAIIRICRHKKIIQVIIHEEVAMVFFQFGNVYYYNLDYCQDTYIS